MFQISDILNGSSKERYISKDITLGCKEIIQILLIHYFFVQDGSSEFVRHFLIEPTSKGVKLKVGKKFFMPFVIFFYPLIQSSLSRHSYGPKDL